MSLQQEQDFLAPFFAQAQAGTIATVAQIKQTFETQVGTEATESIIRRLLDRHGWRKLVPGAEHSWEDLREKQLPNLALATLDQGVEQVCDGLKSLESDPERPRSMTYFPHFRLTC